MTKKIWMSFLILLAFVLFSGLAVYACGTAPNCPMGMKDAKVQVSNISSGVEIKITSDNPEVVKKIQEFKATCQHDEMKNAKFEVSNMANGVTVKITSDSPEVVKKIQQHEASCQKNGHAGCSKNCQEAHASGGCTGHEPGH